MNRKTVGISFIIIGIILLFLIIYILFFYNFNAQQTVNKQQPAASSTAAQQTKINKPAAIINIKPLTKEEISQDELKRLAGSFAERYGSFSNQSNYQNMSDLKIFMTDKFQKATDQFINQTIAKKVDSSIYYGITTKAISQTVDQFDDDAGLAKITVTTQRREALASTDNATSYAQAVTISFLKQNGAWKVDEAVWLPKK